MANVPVEIDTITGEETVAADASGFVLKLKTKADKQMMTARMPPMIPLSRLVECLMLSSFRHFNFGRTPFVLRQHKVVSPLP